MRDETVEIFGELVHETRAAALLDIGLEKKFWVPKSVIANWHDLELKPGQTAEFEIQEWFATKEEMI